MVKVLVAAGGTTLESHEAYVREVIAGVEGLSSEMWPHRQKVYVLLSGSNNRRKIIAFRWSYVAHCSSVLMLYLPENSSIAPHTCRQPNTPFTPVYVFPSLVSATIYTIANGNKNLRDWGLEKWVGQPQVERAGNKVPAPTPVPYVDLDGRPFTDLQQPPSPSKKNRERGIPLSSLIKNKKKTTLSIEETFRQMGRREY